MKPVIELTADGWNNPSFGWSAPEAPGITLSLPISPTVFAAAGHHGDAVALQLLTRVDTFTAKDYTAEKEAS